jgi:hypothetical protein
VIKQAVPRVDLFTELGRRRTKGDMDLEYQRLLARDETPFAFLYNGTTIHPQMVRWFQLNYFDIKGTGGAGALSKPPICSQSSVRS